MSGLTTRIATALVLLPVVLALIWIPSLAPGWALFVLVIAAIGANEYAGLVQAKGYEPERSALVIGVGVVVAAAWFGGHEWSCAALLAAVLVVGFLHVTGRNPSIAGISADLFGLLYVGWFPAHVVLLHNHGEAGPGLVMALIVPIALCDIGAYFVGKAIGRHKLAPVVSPNKTWEGAIGGTVLAVAGMGGTHYVAVTWMAGLFPPWPIGWYLLAGLVLSVAGQIGDLLESSLKRDAGFKDAGTIFPGHGGVLDRFDGYLFAAPVLYYGAVFLA